MFCLVVSILDSEFDINMPLILFLLILYVLFWLAMFSKCPSIALCNILRRFRGFFLYKSFESDRKAVFLSKAFDLALLKVWTPDVAVTQVLDKSEV